MTIVDKEQLTKLRQATNAAIEIISAMRPRVAGAINWGDLSCRCAAHVQTDAGDEYLEVRIEEAAPWQDEFHDDVMEELEKAGWAEVRVVTAW